jgi:hypothetical protein
VEKD